MGQGTTKRTANRDLEVKRLVMFRGIREGNSENGDLQAALRVRNLRYSYEA